MSVLLVVLRRGTSLIHLENLSVSTKSILLPLFERGKGPVKSVEIAACCRQFRY